MLMLTALGNLNISPMSEEQRLILIFLWYIRAPSLDLDPRDAQLKIESLPKASCQFGPAEIKSASSMTDSPNLFQQRHLDTWVVGGLRQPSVN